MNKILIRILGVVVLINLMIVGVPVISKGKAKINAEENNTNSKTVKGEALNNSINTEEDALPVITDVDVQEVLDEQADEKRQSLEDEIKAYLGDNISNVGLSYYDINTGRTIVINGDKTFLAGSTVKVQMNMVLFDMIGNGQVDINENLQYTDDCYEDGTGILQGQDLSKPLPLKLLSDYSIIHSDNIATNMIIKRIGYDNMKNAVDNKLGHSTDHSDNYITANDETTLLKLLYINPDNDPYYPQLIETMKNTDFHDRIDADIPQNIVAHKIGDYDSYVNDVGIVYTKNPYILSVYTNNVNNANEVISHISELIYNYQNS